MRENYTQEKLKEFFDYDPLTGHLTWKVSRGAKIKAGQRAGCTGKNKYRTVGLEGKQFSEHIVIWIWMTGEVPKLMIDHKDRNPSNNKWLNLRQATPGQNTANKGDIKDWKNMRGVTRIFQVKVDKTNGDNKPITIEKFTAQIVIERQRIHLGTFPTAWEAHQNYRAAHRAHYREFSPYWEEEEDQGG